jgi:hypothetical protein
MKRRFTQPSQSFAIAGDIDTRKIQEEEDGSY